MPDLEISRLPALPSSGVQGTDPLAVADLSASETKKLTIEDLMTAGIQLVPNGSITGDQIVSIPGSKIDPNTITAAQLAANSVTAVELANNAVDTAAIQAAAVTNDKLAAGIDGSKLVDGTVVDAKIVSIDGAKIDAASITATQLAPDSVTAVELANNAVDTDAVQDLAITNAKLAGSITGSKLVAETITSREIGVDAVGASELANNSVDTAAIVNAAVTDAKLASGISGGKLTDGTVADSKIVGPIDGGKLASQSVDQTAIANNAIGSNQLAPNAVDTGAVQDGAITDVKITGPIDGTKISGASIGTSQLINGAVTNDKLAGNSVTDDKISGPISGSKISGGSIGTSQLVNGSVTGDKLAASSVTDDKILGPVNGSKLQTGSVAAASLGTVTDRGLDQSTGSIGIGNKITPGTQAGITFNELGLITSAGGDVPASDLPVASPIDLGVVSVPTTGGLSVTGSGELSIANTVTPATVRGITYDQHGNITNVDATIPATDLPLATNAVVGAVSVPGPHLSVDGVGALKIDDSGVIAGTYPKVAVNAKGLVTLGMGLSATDIPAISADKIQTGVLNPARIGDKSIEKEKLANYATTIIQEADPGQGDYVGQFWYKESDSQLRTWSGNSWIPVGFGRLSEENLRFCGTFDAATGDVLQLTPFGVTAGLTPGASIPTASDSLTGVYLVCDVPGTYGGDAYDEGDWVLCLGQAQGWARIDTLSGSGSTVSLANLIDVTLTTPASGDTLIFDGATNKWINKPTAMQKASFVEAIDGSTTSFTLTKDAASANNLLISLGGIIQEPGADFTFTAPRTVNFSTPPPPNSDYWVLIEGVASTGGGGGGGGTTLPDGTAADEYLQWSSTLSSWQPSKVLNGGSF